MYYLFAMRISNHQSTDGSDPSADGSDRPMARNIAITLDAALFFNLE